MQRIPNRDRALCLRVLVGCLALAGLAETGAGQQAVPTRAAIVARVSGAAVPPGGTAQIAITLVSPLPVALGSLSIDLDPLVFDGISAINVFSVAGDQTGIARIQGRHADVEFASNSGGIGRLPAFPLLVMTVPVLLTAKAGGSGAVTVQSNSVWRDLPGYLYSAAFESPGIPIGGELSIRTVVPGGGVVPAGTKVQINGQGFSPDTKLQLDGAAWSNLQFVNSGQLNFTLTAPADLTGKLLVLTGPNGAQARYYSFFIPTVIRHAPSIPDGIQPLFPQVTLTGFFIPIGAVALENPSASSVDVVITPIIPPNRPGGPPPVTKTITIGPEGRYLADAAEFPSFSSVAPALPIRVLSLLSTGGSVGFTASIPSHGDPSTVFLSTESLLWNLRRVDPAPAAAVIAVRPAVTGSLDIVAGTDDGDPWLSASFVPGTKDHISVSVNHAGLAEGVHRGVVSLTPAGSLVHSAQINVQLNVNANPIIVTDATAVNITLPFSATVTIACDSGPFPIRVHTPDSWLSVTPSTATTPVTLSITVPDPSKLVGPASSSIVIEGPANIITLPVNTFGTFPVVNPVALSFSAPVGSIEAVSRRLNVAPTIQPITFDIATGNDGPWLTAAMTNGPGVPDLAVSANPAGLAAGTYQGTVTIHPDNQAGPPPPAIVVPVTLVVFAAPTALTLLPATLEMTVPSKTATSQPLTISSGSLPMRYSIAAQDDAGGWLSVFVPVDLDGPAFTPASVSVLVAASNLAPGIYLGQVIVTAPPGSDNHAVMPVMLTVTPAAPVALAAVPPLLSMLVNGGSLLPGPIAPGEIVTLFGIFGPDATAGLHVGRDGKATMSLYGNRVLFNGQAAPLTYVSPTQISAVVPYEIDGAANATVEVDVSGTRSPTWGVPVANSAPGIFTISGTGQGAALILNEDGSTNTISNPAARGSIVQIFATGEGQTVPPGVTGAITQSDVKSPVLAVRVQIGSADAKVVASTAPDTIAGVFRMTVAVPPGTQSGTLPVVVSVGAASSQTTAVIAVR